MKAGWRRFPPCWALRPAIALSILRLLGTVRHWVISMPACLALEITAYLVVFVFGCLVGGAVVAIAFYISMEMGICDKPPASGWTRQQAMSMEKGNCDKVCQSFCSYTVTKRHVERRFVPLGENKAGAHWVLDSRVHGAWPGPPGTWSSVWPGEPPFFA